MAAARLRLGPALILSALCHGGVIAALATITVPPPPAQPAYHSITVAFVHPPMTQAEPVPEPAPKAVQPHQSVTERKVTTKPVAKRRPTRSPQPAPTPVAEASPQPVVTESAPPTAPQVSSAPAVQPTSAQAAPESAPAPLPVIMTPDYLTPPVPPIYPPAARRLQIEGTVVVRALVERPGHPSRVTLWQSSGESLLDRSALDAVRGWRFRPMTHAGGTVAAWVEVPITFSMTNT